MSSVEKLINAEEAEQAAILRRGQIVECKLVPWGSNYTFAIVLADPKREADDTIAIYKPRAGEAPLWDFPSGTLYQREYAAYLVSRALGWGFIPTTIIRDGPHGIGSVQAYVEPEDDSHYYTFRNRYQDDLMRMAVFDIVTNNADRKAGHCFRGKDDDRIWGIDHGLTFHVHPKLRTVIWDFIGMPVPQHLLDDLIRLYAEDTLPPLLRPHLDALEIEAFRARAARLVDSGVFPKMSSRRSIPYGW
jgi:hypothetical protein